MLQVSYVSQTKEPLSPPALLDLLLQCRRNNKEMGVTLVDPARARPAQAEKPFTAKRNARPLN